MEPLTPGKFYHIYNHANGHDNLFIQEDNYHFFIDKYCEHVSSVVNTYAYCLMPNHIHFLVEVKPESELLPAFPKSATLEKLVSKKFSNLFSSYTQSFNNRYGRKGSLFIKNFRRKHVNDFNYLVNVINYIHFNPVHHGFCKKPEEWDFGSFSSLCSKSTSFLKRDRVFELFGGKDEFLENHKSLSANQILLKMNY